MLLRCREAFGNFKPGDEVEIPDDAIYDGFYFEHVELPSDPPSGESNE